MDLGLTEIITLIVCILISLTIHEFMHAFTGKALGDDTAEVEGRISLNPLKHIDPLMTVALPIFTVLTFGAPILAAKPVPFNPARVKFEEFGAALIAAAGPLSNLLLAFIGVLLFRTIGLNYPEYAYFIQTFVTINVALFVFNMLPIPPLDGSRVLYAFAPEPVQRVMEDMEPYGLFIVFGLVIIGLGSYLTNINQYVLQLIS